jgi:hypothetical protein
MLRLPAVDLVSLDQLDDDDGHDEEYDDDDDQLSHHESLSISNALRYSSISARTPLTLSVGS